MYKIFIILFILSFAACSGIEMRKKLFKNSILVELEISENYRNVSEGKLAIIDKESYENKVEREDIANKFIDNLNHKYGEATTRRYLINVDKLEVGKEYISYIKLFDEKGEEVYIYYSNVLKFDKEHREIKFYIE